MGLLEAALRLCKTGFGLHLNAEVFVRDAFPACSLDDVQAVEHLSKALLRVLLHQASIRPSTHLRELGLALHVGSG